MVLEAVIVCVDNSDWVRNGDYPPTRMAAQTEAVNYICSMKTQANEENAVGVLCMAGSRIDILVTPSRDLGKVMSSVQSVKVGGKSDFIAGIMTAQLCLKNRSNKHQQQRIILFVGSPIEAQAKDLVRLGKQLKKNNVNVDVINFGFENNSNDNREILDAFVASVNSSDSSHLVNVPPGPHNLSDMVLSAIMSEGGQPGMGAQDMVDAAGMDPELAMAIRMSLEEERQRVAAAENAANAAQQAASDTNVTAPAEPVPMAVDDEESMIAQAIAMSMQPSADANPSVTNDQIDSALHDPAFIQSVIDSLPDEDKANLNATDVISSFDAAMRDEEQKQSQNNQPKKKDENKK